MIHVAHNGEHIASHGDFSDSLLTLAAALATTPHKPGSLTGFSGLGPVNLECDPEACEAIGAIAYAIGGDAVPVSEKRDWLIMCDAARFLTIARKNRAEGNISAAFEWEAIAENAIDRLPETLRW